MQYKKISMNDYESKSAAEKEEFLWQKIIQTKYDELPEWTGSEIIPLLPRLLLLPFKTIMRKYMKVTVDLESDFFPKNRTKVIHTFGAVCPIKFISSSLHSFTGLFSGTEYGFIRCSLAKKPEKGDKDKNKEQNMIPGLAIKLLIDNVPSVNFMAMASLEGQTSFNLFEQNFSNYVELPQDKIIRLLAKAFGTVSKDPTKVDVSNIFRIMSNGETVHDPKIANKIELAPNKSQFKFLPDFHEIREDLLEIPVGSILYDVYACEDSTSNKILLGSIVTKDKFICSEFGDSQLFFRHQRFDQNS